MLRKELNLLLFYRISDSTRANLEDIINRAATSLGDSASYEYGTKRTRRSVRDDFNINQYTL